MELNLPPETEARLRQKAALAGKDVNELILNAVEKDMAEEVEARGSDAVLPPDKWKTEFRSWLATFPKRKTHMDDSREAMYRGCGE